MTTPSIKTLIVGRDRAHVRSLLEESPKAQIMSASAFFDHIRLIPFLYDPELRRDDSAPIAFAYNLLGQQNTFSRRMGKSFVTLFSSLFHGTMRPLEVYEQAIDQEYAPALRLAASMESLMEEHKIVNAPSALYKAWQLIKNKELIPPFLMKAPNLSLRYLIDLTALEIEVLKTLASLGINMELIFPLDFANRAINVAVDYAARQFELAENLPYLHLSFQNLASEGPLKPLVEALFQEDVMLSLDETHYTLELSASIDDEARYCAQTIAELKANAPSAKIALALRTFDVRAESYKRALLAMGLEVRDRKGKPLSESPAGLLLKTIFSACHYGLPRKDFLGLSAHPLMVLPPHENPFELLDILGIDDALLLKPEPACRYSEPLARLEAMLPSEQKPKASSFAILLEHLKELLALVPKKCSWQSFLEGQLKLIRRAMKSDDRSVAALHDLVASLLLNAHHAAKHEIELAELEDMLWAELSTQTVLPEDYSDQEAVELVLLPELVGRSFDHIVIPDVAFGRLPKSLESDPLLSDEQRLRLNKIVGRSLLRVYLDDPFEPIGVPSRQALEPFWFAGAIASAKKSVHFSCASLDQNGAALAPSEFFVWLMDHVRIERSLAPKPTFMSHERARFEAGLKLRAEGGSSFELEAFHERRNAFLEAKPGVFAFQMEPKDLLLSFGGRLDSEPSRPLTPTMIEAFSQCRFHGFLNRIIGLSNAADALGDLDARVVGALAHQALERFFASYNKSDSEPAVLLQLVRSAVEEDYLQKNFVPNPELFFCYSDWIFASLLVLIDRLLEAGFGKPLAEELPFGLGAKGKAGELLAFKDNRYLLGGVIDRIDKHGDDVVVMDYKLSRADRLRELSAPRAFLTSNFQIPIYMRLARSAFLLKDNASISFIYASIRDGVLIDAGSEKKSDDTKEALAAAIDRIFAPIKKGQMLATISEQCSMCDFAFVCRKAERGINA